jgi:asparagine synthase (glutamine-hydrolysing)
MKLQCGYLSRSDNLTSLTELTAMLGVYASTPVDISHQIVTGPVAMAYRGDRITSEEDNEIQPLQYGPYLLTFDGRLDNRMELAHKLNLNRNNDIPDPMLIAKAYELSGDSLWPTLIGEFALSMWCSRTRTVLLVRSIDGARTLYFKTEKDRILWCSDFAHLVRTTKANLTPDTDYVQGYLTSVPPSNRTALSSICAVPPNTVLRLSDNAYQKAEVLWTADHIKPLHLKSDHECEEACRDQLKAAVRSRLRANAPVFAELSGGLDSSSVVLIADTLRRSEKSFPDIYTLSRIYKEAETCDERRFIKAVEDSRGAKSFYVTECDEGGTLGFADPPFTGLPSPLQCFPGIYDTYRTLMAQYHSRILVTGIGGDHLFWSVRDGTPLLAEELLSGHFLQMCRDCQIWSLDTGKPFVDLFTQAIKVAVKGGTGPRSETRASQTQALFAQVSAGYFNEYCELYITHPYTYRPLVEFSLSLPFSQFFRDTVTRSIQRRALRGILPPEVANRKSKASADEIFIRLIRSEWNNIGDVRNWQICTRNICGPEQLLRMLHDVRLGFHQTTSVLIRLISLERWLRSLGNAHRPYAFQRRKANA